MDRLGLIQSGAVGFEELSDAFQTLGPGQHLVWTYEFDSWYYESPWLFWASHQSVEGRHYVSFDECWGDFWLDFVDGWRDVAAAHAWYFMEGKIWVTVVNLQ